MWSLITIVCFCFDLREQNQFSRFYRTLCHNPFFMNSHYEAMDFLTTLKEMRNSEKQNLNSFN